MDQEIADIRLIRKILKESSPKLISDGTGISQSSVKKLKSGERSINKMNLGDAIKLTNFAKQNSKAQINIWS